MRPRVNFGRKQEDDLKNFVPEGHPKEGPGACWEPIFSIFSILETPQDRQYTIEIFENIDTFGIFGLGGRTPRSEGYLGACRGSKISIFSIFAIKNIEKIEAHRKKMFDGQDWAGLARSNPGRARYLGKV